MKRKIPNFRLRKQWQTISILDKLSSWRSTSCKIINNILIIRYFYVSKYIFGPITETYHLTQLIYPLDTQIKNGDIVTWYEEEGYGHPVFNNESDAVTFIESEMEVLNKNILLKI